MFNRKDYTQKYQKERYAQRRNDHQCVDCGTSMLTIDHIEGREVWDHPKGLTGHKLYMWIKTHNFPKGFQVLCFNCNISKYKNNGRCAHELLSVVISQLDDLIITGGEVK